MDVARFLPMVHAIVGSYCRRGLPAHIERHDLIQAAMLRLCKHPQNLCSDNADTFAYGMAKWAIQDELRRSDAPTSICPAERADDSPGPCEQLLEKERVSELLRAISYLPAKQAHVIRSVLDGKAQSDLAAEMCVSQSAISHFKTAAVRNLRTRLASRGFHR
jgi:RNA polymerase sigma factor (sigma-70 family)